MLSQTTKRYDLSFDKASIQFGGELQSAIYNNISTNYDAVSKIKHKLIFDRDSKKKTCTREHVKVSSLNNFGQNKVEILGPQVLEIAIDFLVEAIKEEDYSRVISFLSEFNLPSLVRVYQTRREKNSYPFNLAYSDVLNVNNSCINKKHCLTSPSAPFNKYDVNSVISTILKEKGFLNIEARHPSIELSNDFFSEAKRNHDQGINPEKTIQNLILSINLNNQNSKAWKMLSNIYRALQKNDEASMAAVQYAIQSDEQIEFLVYLSKTLQPIEPQEAKRLHELLILMTPKIKETPWAQSQIKDYQ
jgi:tetratricopeptide (TPR) repeat protein